MALAGYPAPGHSRRSPSRREHIAGLATPPQGVSYEEFQGGMVPLRGGDLVRRSYRHPAEVVSPCGPMLREPQLHGPLVRRYPPHMDPRMVASPIRPRHPYGTPRCNSPYSPYYGGCGGHHCTSLGGCYSPPEIEHFDHCSCSAPSSRENPNSNSRKEFDFKTKDVVVRGKGFAVRASYLTESSKFEGDLTKYMDRKSKEEVPDRVVEMVISFINREEYKNESLGDEIVLNILASNVGVKSVVQHSLARLKKWDGEVTEKDVGDLVVLVMCSGKVEDGLKDWLKDFLSKGNPCRFLRFAHTWEGDRLYFLHPEAAAAVETMLGWRSNDGITPYRIL